MYIKRILLILCVIALGIGGFLIWASADIDSGVYIDTLCKGPKDKPCVLLTFDDGPDEVMTPKVLDILKKYNIKATFFVIGKKAEKNPELLLRIVNEGHIVGCHSWDHTWSFPMKSSVDICNEMSQCEEYVYKITGKRMALFRPPFGVTNPLIAEAVDIKKYTCVGWSIRSFDTNENENREDICKRIVKQLHNGAIILLHDRCQNADKLLESLISYLLDKKYHIINFDDMFDIVPYKMDISE